MPQKEEQMSLTDIIKENTSKVLKEVELQSPTHFQIYSDMYKEYMHTLDNMFSMLLLSEKEFIDKMNINPNAISEINRMTEKMTNSFLIHLDNYGDYLQLYAKSRSEMMRACDKHMHSAINLYTQIITNNSKWMNTNMTKQSQGI